MTDTTDTTSAITCRDTTWLVSGARDQPLTPHQARQLAAHLAGCAACQVASRQFAQLFAQLDTLLARDAAPDDA
ncbi:zf-HC2 domain-containing protein [Massilia oculi]|uniref:zf-HC2 domain-containing protein n=1 Tax=Massilia oculi TaxID=945844 RepID=UPI001AAEBC8D|nr:zf-HC2 domain-containing protein [Massilia oculi]